MQVKHLQHQHFRKREEEGPLFIKHILMPLVHRPPVQLDLQVASLIDELVQILQEQKTSREINLSLGVEAEGEHELDELFF